MKLLILALLSVSCTHPKPATGEYWLCLASSEKNESKDHVNGHWGTCSGPENCARREALAKCLRSHPKDCVITKCQQVPEIKKEDSKKTIDEELKELGP